MTTKISIFSCETRDTKTKQITLLDLKKKKTKTRSFSAELSETVFFKTHQNTVAQTDGLIHLYCRNMHLCTSLRAYLNKDVYLWPENHGVILHLSDVYLQDYLAFYFENTVYC